MRIAFLKIFDNVNNSEISTEYQFNKITTFYNLLRDLPKIYKKINSEVEITFIYKLKIVNDYNLYILPHDHIFIKMTKAHTNYFLYDVISKNKLHTSDNIEDLYEIYLKDLYYDTDCEILLYRKKGNKIKLIDVLDSPIHHINKCINRLIRKYN